MKQPLRQALNQARFALLIAAIAGCSEPEPFPAPISVQEAIEVNFVEFATLPDIRGAAARMMSPVDEPSAGRPGKEDFGRFYTAVDTRNRVRIARCSGSAPSPSCSCPVRLYRFDGGPQGEEFR